MKKTILTIALLSAVLGAQAMVPNAVADAAAVAVNTAVGVAVAGPVFGPAAAAIAASAGVAVAAPAPAAAASTSQATVSVKGATTVAGAPLLLSVNGAKPTEPDFKAMFEAGQAHPQWKVVKVKVDGVKSRVYLKSATGNATLEMDVATTLAQGLKIKKDAIVSLETETSGQGALIKFMKDKTPMGFMVNQTTKIR